MALQELINKISTKSAGQSRVQPTQTISPQDIVGAAKKYPQFARDVTKGTQQFGQEAVRGSARLYAAGGGALLKAGRKTQEKLAPMFGMDPTEYADSEAYGYKTGTDFGEAFLGTKKPSFTQEGDDFLALFGVERGSVAAPFVGAGLLALDLLPGGKAAKETIKTLAKSTDEKVISETIRSTFPDLANKDLADNLGKILKSQDDPIQVQKVIKFAIEQERKKRGVTKRYWFDTLPKARQGEKVVGFRETGGDIQWVHTDLEKLRDGTDMDTIHFGVVPESVLEDLGDTRSSIEGVFRIPREIANRVVLDNTAPVRVPVRGESGRFVGSFMDTPAKKIDDTLTKLADEARKYKSAEEFVEAQERKVYETRDGHVAPSADDTPVAQRMEDGGDFSLSEVAKGQHNQPADYFDERVGARYYMYDTPSGRESYNALKPVLDGKKDTLTAYRTVPKEINGDWRDGDWITFSKKYADDHGMSRFGEGEYNITSKVVSKDHVWWDGNDINEWGYDSGKTRSQLTDIWKKAQGAQKRTDIADDIESTYTRTLKEIEDGLESIFGEKINIKTYTDTRKLGAKSGETVYGRATGEAIGLLSRNNSFSEAVANHEGWHWFKRNLSSSKKAELNALEQELWDDVSRTDPNRIEKLKAEYKGESQEVLSEELMADEFARYTRTGKTRQEKLKTFFEKAMEALLLLFRNRDDIMKRVSKEFGSVKKTLRNERAVAEVETKPGFKQKLSEREFKNFTDLSTKLLGKLEGRTTVSKQFISDLTNSPDLKQPERELFRRLLEDEGDTVNVKDFADKVKGELLPLERGKPVGDQFGGRYESITLPKELRGPVASYSEHIYNSPIKTSAGGVHFGGTYRDGVETRADNYFAHSRVEDLPRKGIQFGSTMQGRAGDGYGGDTRRVIEIQSDLFQKGRLENEKSSIQQMLDRSQERRDAYLTGRTNEYIKEADLKKELADKDRLEPYRNTWHERIIREEVKKAAQDGKTKLQFPTGETAMKIEGLGQANARQWGSITQGKKLTPDNLRVGDEIAGIPTAQDFTPDVMDKWIITDVLGDGKFKAVPKMSFGQGQLSTKDMLAWATDNPGFKETFDISGKVDTNNPIYKFYEKDVQKYLRNKYGAKLVTDPQGVSWVEVSVDPKMADEPVDAFKKSQSESYQKAEYEILTQMGELSEMGIKPTEDGYVRYSTFPEWIPTSLRRNDLFKRVIKHIEEGTTPRANATNEQELLDLTKEQIQRRADEYEELNSYERLLTGGDTQQVSQEILVGKAQESIPRNSQPSQAIEQVSSLVPEISKVESLVNTKNLDISAEAKTFIEQATDDVRPFVEDKMGKRLSNKEVQKLADSTSKELERTIGREQTLAWNAAMLNTREKLARLAEAGTVNQEYIETLLTVKTLGADLGRKLQALSIKAQPSEANSLDALLEEILKTVDNADEVIEAAKKYNLKDYKQAVKFYREFVKPRVSDWVDLLRYNSMLSSPLTHIVNIASNLVNSTVVGTLEKLTVGMFDAVRGTVTNTARERYAGEAGVFLANYMGAVGEATQRFAKALRGEMPISNLDTRNIPLATEGAAKAVEQALSIPMRILEATDQFFVALTEAGETAALKYRQGKGVKVPALQVQAERAAQYRLYRQDLFSEGQGTLLDAIDTLTAKLYDFRNSDNPIISNVFKFTIPFIRTPTNIFKQGLEYSPTGYFTLIGATDKQTQLAKATVGTAVFAGAAMLLSSGRLTWAEPTSEKDRNAFRDAGMLPYAVKIGDTWVQYQKLPSSIAFPFAMVSLIDNARKERKLDESIAEMVLSSIAKYGDFLADQSYAKSIGDLLSAIQGGESDWARVAGNVPQQLIPYRALGGWLARLTDDVQRKPDPEGNFIEKQVQLLMMNIPGLSQDVPARTNVAGEEIKAPNNVINAFSPFRVSKQDTRKSEEYQEIKTVQDLDRKARNENSILKDTAESTLEELRSLPKAEARARFEEIRKTNPALARKINDIIDSEKIEYTPLEKQLKESTVEARAQYFVKTFSQMTKEEKSKMWSEMVEKKIITKDVSKRIKELLK